MRSRESILTTSSSDLIFYSLRSNRAITLWNFNANACLITTEHICKHMSQTHMTQRRTHTVLRVSGLSEPGKLTGLLTQVGWRHSYHRQQWQDAKTRRQHARRRCAEGESMLDTHTRTYSMPPEMTGNKHIWNNLYETCKVKNEPTTHITSSHFSVCVCGGYMLVMTETS